MPGCHWYHFAVRSSQSSDKCSPARLTAIHNQGVKEKEGLSGSGPLPSAVGEAGTLADVVTPADAVVGTTSKMTTNKMRKMLHTVQYVPF